MTLTSANSFLDVTNWLWQLRTHASCWPPPSAVICGNKADHEEDARAVSKRDALKLAER